MAAVSMTSQLSYSPCAAQPFDFVATMTLVRASVSAGCLDAALPAGCDVEPCWLPADGAPPKCAEVALILTAEEYGRVRQNRSGQVLHSTEAREPSEKGQHHEAYGPAWSSRRSLDAFCRVRELKTYVANHNAHADSAPSDKLPSIVRAVARVHFRSPVVVSGQ